MKPFTPDTLALDSLLDELILDQLSIEKLAQLEQILTSDERAFDQYRRSVSLHAMLAALSTRVPAAYLSSGPSSEAVNAMLPRGTFVSLATGSLWKRSRATATLLMFGLAVSFVVATYFAGLAGLVAWDRIYRAANHDQFAFNRSDDYVATIDDATDAQWSIKRGPNSTERSILRGEPLRIDAGQVALNLKRGVSLLVEGPAEWSIDSDNGATLNAGKILAMVPTQAVGFTLSTPTARIVDLGTEFGVEVSESGTTDVQVSQGKVQLYAGRQSSVASAQPPITLSAGSARRIEVSSAGETNVREIVPNQNRVTRNSSSHQLATAALASSEAGNEFGRNVNNIVNGSGLSKEKHTNEANGTMWHTAYGKIKGEFVLFDLFRPCRVESMKVWNYNENVHPASRTSTLGFEERGVAQADIYVSATGKGDPISQPQQWQRIVENRQFAMADGMPEYSTPEVISLGNVEARFVAIVIDSRHHHERTPLYECVGLSEVQFFGNRLTPATR